MKLRSIRRLIGLLALFDGVSTLIAPGAYLRKLESGFPTIDDMLDYLAENPALARKLSVAEIAVGAWLTFR